MSNPEICDNNDVTSLFFLLSGSSVLLCIEAIGTFIFLLIGCPVGSGTCCLVIDCLVIDCLVGGCLVSGCFVGGCFVGGCLVGGCFVGGCFVGGCFVGGCLVGGCLVVGCLVVGCLVETRKEGRGRLVIEIDG